MHRDIQGVGSCVARLTYNGYMQQGKDWTTVRAVLNEPESEIFSQS